MINRNEINKEVTEAVEEIFGEGFDWTGADFYEGETLDSLKAKYTEEEAQNWDLYTEIPGHGVIFAN